MSEYQVILEGFLDQRSFGECLLGRLLDEEMTHSNPLAIKSQAKLDFLTKMAKFGPESFNPEWSQRRAGRDEDGKIVSAGGGAPHGRPNISQSQAQGVVHAFFRGGGRREDLPKYSNPDNGGTTDAPRNRARRPQVKRNQYKGPPQRQDGDATLRRQQGWVSNAMYVPRVDPQSADLGGGWQVAKPAVGVPRRKKRKKKQSQQQPQPEQPLMTAQDIQKMAKEKRKEASKSAKRKTRRRRPRGGTLDMNSKYLSKTIDEDFNNVLESALGL